jgi:hypothetical protein
MNQPMIFNAPLQLHTSVGNHYKPLFDPPFSIAAGHFCALFEKKI